MSNKLSDLSDEDRARFTEIDAKLKELNGPTNAKLLLIDMQLFLKARADTWRERKRSAPRVL